METKIVESKHGIIKQDLGYWLHVALRKNCDSPATSLAWNVLGMDAMTPAWKIYLERVWAKLDQYTAENVHALLNTVADELINNRDNPGFPNQEGMVLYCTFRLFSVEDWECMASKLYTEMKRFGNEIELEPTGVTPVWTDHPTPSKS